MSDEEEVLAHLLRSARIIRSSSVAISRTKPYTPHETDGIRDDVGCVWIRQVPPVRARMVNGLSRYRCEEHVSH